MRRRGVTIAAALVAGAMMLAGGGIAYADTLVYEDDLIAGPNLQLGVVECGASVSATIDLKIRRQGNITGGQSSTVYANSTAVSITKTGQSNVTASDPAPQSITTPGTWTTSATNTLAGNASSTITVDTSTAGTFTGTVSYRASGTNVNGGTHTVNETLTAKWTVLDCTQPPVDSTAPVVVLTCPTEPVMRHAVAEATWTASDEVGGSGLSASSASSGSVTLDTSTYGSKTASVAAGTVQDNAGNPSAEVTCDYFVTESDPPVVSLVCPIDPLLLHSVAEATWTATDEEGGSGLNPSFPSSGSVSLYTSSVGTHTASVAAGTVEDNAGNASEEATCSYSVIFDFDGFFRPVDMGDTVNSVKAGSAVPIKFSLAGDQGLGVIASGYPKVNRYACGILPNVDDIEETVTAGGSSLSYDPIADQYVYVWKTDKVFAGSCGTLSVKLSDGTVHTANFQFKK